MVAGFNSFSMRLNRNESKLNRTYMTLKIDLRKKAQFCFHESLARFASETFRAFQRFFFLLKKKKKN